MRRQLRKQRLARIIDVCKPKASYATQMSHWQRDPRVHRDFVPRSGSGRLRQTLRNCGSGGRSTGWAGLPLCETATLSIYYYCKLMLVIDTHLVEPPVADGIIQVIQRQPDP